MQTTLTSNLKVTTNWPELVNHRIQSLDSVLEEVRLETQEALLIVWGIIHRKMVCLNERNQCRKVEDRIQFAINLPFSHEIAPPWKGARVLPDSAPMKTGRLQMTDLSLSNIELIQTDFVFQPRSSTNGPAVLEQTFTLVIHSPPDRAMLHRKPLQVWAKLVIDKGGGKMVLDLPVGLLGSTFTPRHFNGAIRFQPPVTPPIVGGVLKGTITYSSREKELKELEFETAINFLLERPPRVQGNQTLWVTGDLLGSGWRFAPGGGWRLEIKFQYQWLVIEEQELWIVTLEDREASFADALEKYAFNQELKKLEFKRLRNYEFDRWNFEPVNVKVRMDECLETPVSKGLLLVGKLCFEAYGIDATGRETFETRTVSFEELAPLNPGYIREVGPGELRFHHESEVALVKSHAPVITRERLGGGSEIQQWEVLLNFRIRLYREQVVALPPSGGSGVPLLTCMIGERQRFTLEGEATLTLQVRPREIIKLKVRRLEAAPTVNDGWIGVDGRMEVAVGFVDDRFRYYETTFTPFFQGVFIWDKLQLQDMVGVQCHLNHHSYTWIGTKVCCRYWLTLVMENRREVEIRVETITPAIPPEPEKPGVLNRLIFGGNKVFHHDWRFGRSGPLELDLEKDEVIHSGRVRFPEKGRYIIAGEIPLKMGRAREMGTSNLRLSGAKFQWLNEALIIEGVLRGTVEYWDQVGFLQRELVELSFWRLSHMPSRSTCFQSQSRTHELPWDQGDFHLELINVSITPLVPPPRGKGKVRVKFEIKLQSI